MHVGEGDPHMHVAFIWGSPSQHVYTTKVLLTDSLSTFQMFAVGLGRSLSLDPSKLTSSVQGLIGLLKNDLSYKMAQLIHYW